MAVSEFFDKVVAPSCERLGIYGISTDVTYDGRKFVVTQKVSKNILTEFDGHLSRYLAAITGEGLPNSSVETTIRDVETGRTWCPYGARNARSVVEALATAVRLSLGTADQMTSRVGTWLSEEAGFDEERVLDLDVAHSLDKAGEICAHLGQPEFLDVTGDLTLVMARPHKSNLDMVMMGLENGTVTVPTSTEPAGTAYQGPLFGFDKSARRNPGVAAYLAKARHYVALAKEDAVYAFREAAEARIMEFDSALAGRDLSGYRLDSARSLVSRLQAGLGNTLLGLSEAAQLTALDWASEVRQLPNAEGKPQVEAKHARVARGRPQLVK